MIEVGCRCRGGKEGEGEDVGEGKVGERSIWVSFGWGEGERREGKGGEGEGKGKIREGGERIKKMDYLYKWSCKWLR